MACTLTRRRTGTCAARAGWETWYVRNSEVLHEGSSSTGMKLWKRTPTYWFDSRLHYFTKNHGRAYAAGATLARLTGALLWRTRAILSRRSIGDPPHFLRDLVTHFAGNIRRRSASCRCCDDVKRHGRVSWSFQPACPLTLCPLVHGSASHPFSVRRKAPSEA